MEKHLKLVEEINSCTKCELCKTSGLKVPGEGNLQAKIFICGEAAGAEEEKQGRPFVGRSGKLLNNMLASIELKREDVWIGNTVCCRPPNNRNPLPEESAACRPFFLRRLEIIKPKVIVALGNVALGTLTGVGSGITKRCGKWEEVEIEGNTYKILPQMHPSALLRNPKWKEPAWYTMQELKKYLDLEYEK